MNIVCLFICMHISVQWATHNGITVSIFGCCCNSTNWTRDGLVQSDHIKQHQLCSLFLTVKIIMFGGFMG